MEEGGRPSDTMQVTQRDGEGLAELEPSSAPGEDIGGGGGRAAFPVFANVLNTAVTGGAGGLLGRGANAVVCGIGALGRRR